jgi:hypothetical protein
MRGAVRFLLMVQTPAAVADAGAGDDDLAAGMAALLEEMAQAGVLLDAGGLRPIDEAVRVRLVGREQRVVNGPFTESKEFVGGYCLLQARSMDEAVQWATRFLTLHRGEWTMTMEIRQLDAPA